MSYDIAVFHAEVKRKVEQGLALDAFARPPLAAADAEAFRRRLALYRYGTGPGATAVLGKDVSGCPIEVHIFATEISFPVPYRSGSEDAIFTALQDASDLSDSDSLALWDPQSGKWIGGEDA